VYRGEILTTGSTETTEKYAVAGRENIHAEHVKKKTIPSRSEVELWNATIIILPFNRSQG